MNWIKPVYKKLAASELGAGHTSGIVPARSTQPYFGVPNQPDSHLIKKIFIDFWDGEKSKTIAVNVNYFKSGTHDHIHLTGNLLPAYKTLGAEVGDVLVFWRSESDPLSYKAELIKNDSKRWIEAGPSAFDAAGGSVDLLPPDDAEVADSNYESPSIVEETITSTDFPTITRQGRQKQAERMITVRNKAKGDFVLKQQNYKCQIDETHNTFTTRGGLPYMEKHHLISMKYYENYTNDLDDISNIVSLCPNCHRKIHLGTDSDIAEMLEILYDQQDEKLEAAGFEITLDELKKSYGLS